MGYFRRGRGEVIDVKLLTLRLVLNIGQVIYPDFLIQYDPTLNLYICEIKCPPSIRK